MLHSYRHSRHISVCLLQVQGPEQTCPSETSKVTGKWIHLFITTVHHSTTNPLILKAPCCPCLSASTSSDTLRSQYCKHWNIITHSTDLIIPHLQQMKSKTMKIQKLFSLQPETRHASSNITRNFKGKVHLQLGSYKTSSSSKKIKMGNSEWPSEDARGCRLIILNFRDVIHGVRQGLKVKNTDQ